MSFPSQWPLVFLLVSSLGLSQAQSPAPASSVPSATAQELLRRALYISPQDKTEIRVGQLPADFPFPFPAGSRVIGGIAVTPRPVDLESSLWGAFNLPIPQTMPGSGSTKEEVSY